MLRFSLSVAALLLSAQVIAAPPTSVAADVDRVVADDMAKHGTPAVSVAVIQDGQVVLKKTWGVANVELAVPATNQTLYTLASTTKEFTGVAIMSLVEQGKIGLDDPVRKYLPELPARWAPVTIRQCLAHTSGLPDGDAPDDVNVLPLAGTRDDLLKLLADKPVKAPGEATVYNQTEFMLLGDIIARVSGEPYQTYITERLLRPLGITSMRWGDGWTVIPGRASLYTALQPTADRSKLQLDAKGRPVYSTTGINAFGSKVVPGWLMPAAGLSGNLDALTAWELALWNGKVIKPATLAIMSQPYALRDGRKGDFGLAVMPYMVNNTLTVSSGGGAAVWVTTVPSKHLTVIVLTNLQASSPGDLVEKLLYLYAPSLRGAPGAP
ncbi:CubicO group peptidase (beta-lactamase class C family) [Luteibacter sp. Sphag1AF]|uniref:serine hydrolase domain-containing protein n=1 Tax=Luteibacter sp. Sphag1AF TaxID=2587031 RepID=UPI001613EEBE|nr:serine hydrolase domain-containing protein [Luteibacter sp. Sphag1AF]MBB3228855.1 CubicO group peptidase (beta-lactamase class C family) [Luteibacter sp. Sphag1AF]